ncbi:MAG: cell division protein FtsH, partial [Planctomycetes bacterium]|nr:cell division protein FtsH [Planctomycetota bacterium]
MGTAGYISTVVLFLLGGVILGMVLAGKKEAVIFRGRRTAGRAGGNVLASQLIRQHFHPAEPESLEISERVFPIRVRPDLQRVLDRLTTGDNASGRFFAVHRPHQYESIGFTGLIIRDDRPAIIVPPKYEEVDVGEDEPVRCLQNGVWLLERIGTRYAVLCEPAQRFHQVSGVRFQIATTVDATSPAIVEAFFNELEQAVRRAHSYRGKILSLTESQPYSGLSSGIMVHRLRRVDREQVILPSATLALLDRNVIDFARRRAELTRFGQSIKKGLLLYGPPGTG